VENFTFFFTPLFFSVLSLNWGCAPSETVAQKMVIIRTERADRLPLVHSLYSTALLLAQHQVPPDLLYVFGSRLFLHTHTHTHTHTLAQTLCTFATLLLVVLETRKVVLCSLVSFLYFLFLLCSRRLCLSFYFSPSNHTWCLSFPPLKSVRSSVSLITSYAVL